MTEKRSEPAEGVTGRRRVVRLTTVKNAAVPETELIPYRPMSDKAKDRLARILARKKGISFEDSLADINEEEARRKKESFTDPETGQLVTRRPIRDYVKKSVTKKGRRKKPSPAMIAKREEDRRRAESALELRKAGVTYQKIADSLGYSSAGAAKNAVDRLLKRQEFEAAKDVVLIDLQRLDEYQARCTERLRNSGDLGQIDRLMRIMEMRYRIIGVNEETSAELQQHFGLNVVNKGVMVVQGSEQDFVRAMMSAVGVDPDSPEGKRYVDTAVGREIEAAPMRGEEEDKYTHHKRLNDEEIVDAEIIDEMDATHGD